MREFRETMPSVEGEHGLGISYPYFKFSSGELVCEYRGNCECVKKAISRIIALSRATCAKCGARAEEESDTFDAGFFGGYGYRICDGCFQRIAKVHPGAHLYLGRSRALVAERIRQLCDQLDLYYVYTRIVGDLGYTRAIYIGVSRIPIDAKATLQYNAARFVPVGSPRPYSVDVISHGLVKCEGARQERDAIALVKPDRRINKNRGGSTGPDMYSYVGRLVSAMIGDPLATRSLTRNMRSFLDSLTDGVLNKDISKIIQDSVNEYYRRQTQAGAVERMPSKYIFSTRPGYQTQDELRESIVRLLKSKALGCNPDDILL